MKVTRINNETHEVTLMDSLSRGEHTFVVPEEHREPHAKMAYIRSQIKAKSAVLPEPPANNSYRWLMLPLALETAVLVYMLLR